MTLTTQINGGFTRVGTEFKTVRSERLALIGVIASLSTTDKSNLVAAINEVAASVGAAAGIDDTTTSSSSTWSSQKTSDELAAAIAALPDPGAMINDSATATDSVWSSDKTNTAIADAITAAVAALPDPGALIDDTGTATDTVWSSDKTNTSIADAVAALVSSAPGTLDTLKELADALGDDANFSTTVTTALGNRVRTDTAAQGLTSTQKTNATTNIGAAVAADVGDTTTDFVATFEAALT